MAGLVGMAGAISEALSLAALVLLSVGQSAGRSSCGGQGSIGSAGVPDPVYDSDEDDGDTTANLDANEENADDKPPRQTRR